MPVHSSDQSNRERGTATKTPLGPDQKLRVGAYTLIATLLRHAPDLPLLDYLVEAGRNNDSRDEIASALNILAKAAMACTPEQAESEFQRLFVGVEHGELVPFGSWYLTGFLREKPLSRLRTDLSSLGYERKSAVTEAEDHAAALAEVMAMLISDSAEHEAQQKFFEKHIGPWFSRFFKDLQEAKSASFYQAVGQFGSAFTRLETRYFSMQL